MTFRFARHTNNLEKIKSFYTTVLGLQLLGGFESHNGYNGIFLGKTNVNWHIEFTQSDKKAHQVFDEDDILVFYPDSILEYETILENINKNSISFIQPKNQYWLENGKMILDPDNYRIVISNIKIK